MLRLIILVGGTSIVVSAVTSEWEGKEESFRFSQTCNECWCRKGKPVCTNKGCHGLGEVSECANKEDNYEFTQGCNECWCLDGKAYCTNKGCTFINFEDDENSDDEPARDENAIGVHAWDLEPKFPENDEKQGMRKSDNVTPYPPSLYRRFNTQPLTIRKPLGFPPDLIYNHPDAGGLNALNDAEVIQQQLNQQRQHQQKGRQYQQYPQYAVYPPYAAGAYSS